MSIIVNLPKRSEQLGPLTAYQWDVEVVDVIEAAFASVTLNTGSVTSVAMTVPTGLSVSGSPITSSGTLAVTVNMAAGLVKSTGVSGNLVTVSTINILTETTGTLSIARGGTNATSFTSNRVLVYDGTSLVSASASTTEVNYLVGVTSAIQTQLNAKQPTITVLPYGNGGTNYAASSRQDLLNNLTNIAGATSGQVLTYNGTNAVFAAASSVVAGTGISVSGSTVSIKNANTFTSFGVMYWDGSGFQMLNNPNFKFDETNEFLGVGTPTPAYAVDAQGDGGGGATTINLVNTGTDPADEATIQAQNNDSTVVAKLVAPNDGENAYVGTTLNEGFDIRTNDEIRVSVSAVGVTTLSNDSGDIVVFEEDYVDVKKGLASSGMTYLNTGDTATIGNDKRGLILGTGVTYPFTVTLPAAPADGQEILIMVSSSVSAQLTVNTTGGIGTVGNFADLTINIATGATSVSFKYNQSQNKYYRIT